MKKHPLLMYILIFPVLFTTLPATVSLCFPRLANKITFTEPAIPEKNLSETYINVLYTDSNTVRNVPLEEHLVGVLAAEMPAAYEAEALKAQAVAARSFILSKLDSPDTDHPDADVCTDSSHCKAWLSEKDYTEKWQKKDRAAYQSKLLSAVSSTRGEYMVCEEKIVEAFFFAGSGGRTESSEDVWGGERPYLKSVESPGDVYSPHYSSTVTVPTPHFKNTLKSFSPLYQQSSKAPVISSITRTEGGSVSSIIIDGHTFSGNEIRQLFGLKSANFTISALPDTVTFHVLGYGHGVGMSQFGANFMAKNGKNYTEILSHYYTNIQIIKN